MRNPIRCVIFASFFLLSVITTPQVEARSLWDEIFEDVHVEGQCLIVNFVNPVQYLRHSPADTGEVLLIWLRLTSIGSRDFGVFADPQSPNLPFDNNLNITAIYYESLGDSPILSIYFNRETTFKIRSGRDFRSIVVGVIANGVEPPCLQMDDAVNP